MSEKDKLAQEIANMRIRCEQFDDFDSYFEIAIFAINNDFVQKYIDESIDALAGRVTDDMEEYLFQRIKEYHHSEYKYRF